MADSSSEAWVTESNGRHEHVMEPFLRITKIDWEGRSRIYLNKSAYDAVGSPEYVSILFKNSQNGHMIKLVPSMRGLKNARRMRPNSKGIINLGGAASLTKKYKMPFGYYILENGIFTWRMQ